MEFHELQKTRVTDLRAMAKENFPNMQGIVGLKKEELVNMLAEKLGIEKPHKHVEAGLGKRAIKAEIREYKVKREAAKADGNKEDLAKFRKLIHRNKRKLRRMMTT
jgi:hypothetical protein